jgi:CDP-diacylglycerol---serine O-phosphatidyltransferase
MNFLWRSENHFNLANLITMINISAGLIATYFISQNNFFMAIIFAWVGGACDIIDGKIARKYKLSNEFGIQLDSFADFLSFVLVPVFLIFQAVFIQSSDAILILAGIASIYYVISGLRRLIQFNIDADAGEVDKFFKGVPTPLGAILLWLVYLSSTYDLINGFGVIGFIFVIAWLLNSNVKIPHP